MQRVTLKRFPRRNCYGDVTSFIKGQKSLADDKLTDLVYEFLKGRTDADACALVGLSEKVFYGYMRHGRVYEEALDSDTETDARHKRFYNFRKKILHAKAMFRAGYIDLIHHERILVTDPKSAWVVLEVLGRRDPENWASTRTGADSRRTSDYAPDEAFL